MTTTKADAGTTVGPLQAVAACTPNGVIDAKTILSYLTSANVDENRKLEVCSMICAMPDLLAAAKMVLHLGLYGHNAVKQSLALNAAIAKAESK